MPDIIQLLSDHLANQIAAGEVIQRPASAVKELLENAIDAGASEVQLILKDAGKELIQVMDNGCGMSPTDARMSFERHATSKIKSIDDLFTIRTMGFRGEALASIAAVAQVELKTKKNDIDTGTRLVIEGTEVKLQEPCATANGTSISVKNLFFNVPARRHFLKSNTTEFRHILDEFTRVALAHPQVAFRLYHNGAEQYHLESGNLKTRIVSLLGNSVEKNLVPVEEDTEFVRIQGFIGKPEAANKSRGSQFFFINNRFIRSAFLNHAVITAYEGLIQKDEYPLYVLFHEVDPARVDVNVHPTKQEVKFEDDRMMYAYLHAAVKHALARYNIAPSLDFTLNPEITQLPSVNLPVTETQKAATEKGYLYNNFTQKNQAHFIDASNGLKKWKDLYEINRLEKNPDLTLPSVSTLIEGTHEQDAAATKNTLLVQNSLLLATVRSGIMIVHVRRAQERIWYERLKEQYEQTAIPSQRLLFPISLDFSVQDGMLLMQLLPELNRIGFDIASFGKNSFVIQGMPSCLPSGGEKQLLDSMIEHLKHESSRTQHYAESLIQQLARNLSVNRQPLQQTEHQHALIDELFACSQPEYTPGGKKIFSIMPKEMLDDVIDK